jgi:hypothetical protein
MCTGFAAYFQEPIYGTNFDLANPKMKFKVTSYRDIDRFHFSVNLADKKYIDAAVLNSKGLFFYHLVLIEDSNNNNQAIARIGPNKGYSLVRALDNLTKESDKVRDFIQITKKKKLKYPIHPLNANWKIHSLIADRHGDAIIFEKETSGNVILPIEGKFIVITNFAIRLFRGIDYRNVSGAGDDRYILATEMLLNCENTLDVDSGFQILKRTAQFSGDNPTECSMIFRPLKKEVYISLHRQFDKVYRVSLKEKIIETYRGFENYKKKQIGITGILSSTLANF